MTDSGRPEEKPEVGIEESMSWMEGAQATSGARWLTDAQKATVLAMPRGTQWACLIGRGIVVTMSGPGMPKAVRPDGTVISLYWHLNQEIKRT